MFTVERLEISVEERAELERRARAHTSSQRAARRARDQVRVEVEGHVGLAVHDQPAAADVIGQLEQPGEHVLE